MLKSFKAVTETRYLSEINYTHYRPIMRLFYLEHQKMRYQMEKDEILALLKEAVPFQEYSEEQLSQDLNQLVKWKNLVPIQDTHKHYTIADFKNQQFQYMMTPAAFHVEQMTVTLEGLSTRAVGLTTYIFGRIQDDLAEMGEIERWDWKNTLEWWNKLRDDFQQLSESYQEYLREFHTAGTGRKLDAASFVAYKQNLIQYLENFIQDLQSSAAQIRGQLEAIPPERVERALDLVLKSQLAAPDAWERGENWEQEQRSRNAGIWQSLCGWFCGQDATARRVLDITNEIIRRVVQNAALLIQMEAMGSEKKAELRHLARLFARCDSVEDAHRLSAMAFGVPGTRHFTRDVDSGAEWEGDCLYRTAWQDRTLEARLLPRTRAYKPRMDKSGFPDRSHDRLLRRKRFLAEAEALRTRMETYIKDGLLDFSSVSADAPLEPSVRSILLSWLTIAETAPDHRGRTEYGRAFTLEKRPGVCVLSCTDGTLTMPNRVLHFEEDGHG